jgi:hypothetical protein
MAYYVRVLSTSEEHISLATLQAALTRENYPASLRIAQGTDTEWSQIVLEHDDGSEIAVVERSPVEIGSLGAAELASFAAEITDCQPASAVQWLKEYFQTVRSIYAFQLLPNTENRNSFEIFTALKNEIWSAAPAILQADGEGFSNEDGYHILWQFGANVTGSWWMGVLLEGMWVHFQMDLGDENQRAAFLQGEIPPGAVMD